MESRCWGMRRLRKLDRWRSGVTRAGHGRHTGRGAVVIARATSEARQHAACPARSLELGESTRAHSKKHWGMENACTRACISKRDGGRVWHEMASRLSKQRLFQSARPLCTVLCWEAVPARHSHAILAGLTLFTNRCASCEERRMSARNALHCVADHAVSMPRVHA